MSQARWHEFQNVSLHDGTHHVLVKALNEANLISIAVSPPIIVDTIKATAGTFAPRIVASDNEYLRATWDRFTDCNSVLRVGGQASRCGKDLAPGCNGAGNQLVHTHRCSSARWPLGSGSFIRVSI